ncbi:MAG: hypothetical protein ABSE90_11940 [Verrucomicrobiota bacterium]|jgi:hypothetical protein
MKIIPQTEIEKKRAAWLVEHSKSEMSIGEKFQLLDQCRMLFPATPEDRRRKTESLMAMPEFAL